MDAIMDGLRADIAAAIDRAKLRHDPMAAILELQWMMLDGMQQAASKPVIEDEDIRRLSDAAARGADRRAAELARTHQWRLLLAGATFVTVLAGAAASVGYWAGGGFNTTCWPQKGGLACGYWLVDPAR